MQTEPFTFDAIEELEPGPLWAGHYNERWPALRHWYLQGGEAARPSYAVSIRMLRAHMPELVPVYERLVDLAGGGDLVSRFLSMYNPPPFLAGCSQAAWMHGTPILVRNYDYAPSRLEGVVLSTKWTSRRVIGMSDCLWGLLDGMNDAGLAASLTFGGRRVVGDGFGIPILMRYVLETCETVADARGALARIPCNLAHNVTVVDRGGASLTVHLSPDREPMFTPAPMATNHQAWIDWPEQARATRTVEREEFLQSLLAEPSTTPESLIAAFLREPLYSTAYERGFGTLYTAAYRAAEGRVEYLWPDSSWAQSFDGFAPGSHTAALRGVFPEPAAASE